MEIRSNVVAETPAQRVVMSFFDALGGTGTLESVFTPDATWTVWGDSPLAGRYEGRDAVVNGFHAEAGKLFLPGAEGILEIDSLIGAGSTVAVEFSYQTTTALQRRYHNHYVEVFDVRDVKVAHVREYMDTQHLGKVCY